jgi:uncharacterized damage-inducible protein DinB
MTKDDFQLLYEYDRWANNRVLEAASALTLEKFTHDLGGSFSSVRDTILHIVAGEWIWLSYWNAPDLSPALQAELRTRRDAIFNPRLFPDFASVQSKWAEVEKDQIAFLSRLTDDLLQKMLPTRAGHASLAHLMQHMANHSTYHRGQVSLMMRQLHARPVATDFTLFIADQRREPATATPSP